MTIANNPLADDGFGNLISVPEPERITNVYARVGGYMAHWAVATGNPEEARNAVRRELLVNESAVLALIEGGYR